MIRQLREADRDAAQALLETAPYLNLYMLGNIESLGFGHEECQFWGDIDPVEPDGSSVRGIINRYMHGWTIFGRTDANWPALARVLDEHPVPAARLQDNPGGAPSLLPYITNYAAAKVSETQLMDLAAGALRPQPAPSSSLVRRATLADLAPLVAFYADAEQMTRSAPAVARPLHDTRVWVAEVDRTLVAAALTNAETRTLAMIGGVFTKPAWRNRGFSLAVCSALCAELIGSGRKPVLYWETAAAGAVYRKLGFQARGIWRSVWLERCR
jgi:predicted GNAT family acetyltransferase